MVWAALGVVYLLASATANGWNLLQLGLLTSTNSSDDLRNRTEAGPRDRGGPSRPDPGLGGNGTWDWWSVAWDGAYHYVGNSWWIKMWVRMLLQVAENGISYCGTLCASIGLAARWSYWLLTGMVLVSCSSCLYGPTRGSFIRLGFTPGPSGDTAKGQALGAM